MRWTLDTRRTAQVRDLEESPANELLPSPPSSRAPQSSEAGRRLLGVGLLLAAFVLTALSVYLGYLEYTSPLTALDRQAHEALERDVQQSAKAQGYTVEMEPYEEVGLAQRIVFQPTSLFALAFLIVGVGLVLPLARRNRERPPWEREASSGSDSAELSGVQHAHQADAPEWPDSR